MGICEKENNVQITNLYPENKNISQKVESPQTHTEKKLYMTNINSVNNIDILIQKLLNPGLNISSTIKEEEIIFIINESLNKIKEQKVLVELEAPINICGDIHGQYSDLLRIFDLCGYPPKNNYLFLGNYVGFGIKGIEVMCLLLCYKIKYPEKITLLRGNHESSVNNRIYGFYDECKRKYNVKLWREFTNLFNYLPLGAIIDNVIFCVHSGLSPYLKSPNDIFNIVRPTEIPDVGLLTDILNSTPSKEVDEYDEGEGDDGVSIIFGEKCVKDFCKKNNLDLIVRGNQAVKNGYEFFAEKKLVTIFSAPNFMGKNNNVGCILNIAENLNSKFTTLNPK